MRMGVLLFVVLSVSIPWTASANPASFTTIAPIFGQLITFSLPAEFATVNEQSNDRQYIREAVLKGETVERWSQMITVTGFKELEVNPKLTAQFFAASLAKGIQSHCPDTFSVKPMGPTQISGEDAFVAISSCGKLGPASESHSETALVVTIKGSEAFYTIQWAERTPASAENLTIDEAKWKERLQKLIPIRVCPIVAGEKAPYPSCLNKK